MLINTSTSFKKDDIVTIKNTLGEEIISKFVEESDTHYVLSKPLALGMNQQGFQFMPVVVSGVTDSSNLQFPKSLVMWAVPTETNISSEYIQVTTGLAVPGNKGQILHK